jgi:predicted permease
MLLVGTGLFVRSLRNVAALRTGMEAERVLIGTMNLREAGFDPARAHALFREVEARVREVPGVAGASIAVTVPFASSFGVRVTVPGSDTTLRSLVDGSYVNAVSPGFFATMGTRVLRGRDFTAADDAPGRRPIVINETMARLYWRADDPLGRCVRLGADTTPCHEIVGVVEDMRKESLTRPERLIQVYLPLEHARPSMVSRVIVVRPSAGVAPMSVAEPVRRAMQTAAPDLPYAAVRPLSSSPKLTAEMRPWRVGATMFGVFGALALVLAAVGLYGVISYTVAERTREMGVRMALGARAGDVVRLVMSQAFAVTVVGAAVGTLATLAAGGVIEPLLFRVSPRDPVILLLVVATLLLVAAAACLVPARRATRVDPVVALRE